MQIYYGVKCNGTLWISPRKIDAEYFHAENFSRDDDAVFIRMTDEFIERALSRGIRVVRIGKQEDNG